MKYWPLSESYSKLLPKNNKAGSFWEDRGDRFHCGVDIYAPEDSEVIAVESGIVMNTGIFTTQEMIPYWNKTYYILIETKSGFICKYAELGKIIVKKGDEVKAGQIIGYVGMVLNKDKIDSSSPLYIQKLKNKNPSMLHFELYYAKAIETHKLYLGGNWFGKTKPDVLLNPYEYLLKI